MLEHKVGEVKCPNVRGAVRWLSELCKALEENGYVCEGDRMRSIATPMKDIGQIHPAYYEKPITIKQWLCITNNALLGLGDDDRVMEINVYFRDTSPYMGGYNLKSVSQLSKEEREKLKEEVKSFIEKFMANRRLPKEAQCQIIV